MNDEHTPASPRPRHRPSRRAHVIEAATRVFSRMGPEASVADVATEAGMAPAAIYYHFKSKEQLLGAVLERLSQAVTACTRDENGNLLDIPTTTRNVWSWMATHENEARLIYLWMVPASTEADAVRRRFFERHVFQSGQRVNPDRGRGRHLTVLERLAARTVVTLTLKISIARLSDETTQHWSNDDIVAALTDAMTRVLTAPDRLREMHTASHRASA